MKAHLFKLGIAAVAAVVLFTTLAVLETFMAAHTLPFPNTLIPRAEVAEARFITEIISPEIEADLSLSPNQRLISVVGHVHCTEGERVRISVEITQPGISASALGHTQDVCMGAVQTWTVLAVAHGRTVFEEGFAQACAEAITRRNDITDRFQWCIQITLVEAGS